MFSSTFPSNEKPATASTVAGDLDLENQRYPRRASEWVAVTRDCDHSRKSGISSMVDWWCNPKHTHEIRQIPRPSAPLALASCRRKQSNHRW